MNSGQRAATSPALQGKRSDNDLIGPVASRIMGIALGALVPNIRVRDAASEAEPDRPVRHLLLFGCARDTHAWRPALTLPIRVVPVTSVGRHVESGAAMQFLKLSLLATFERRGDIPFERPVRGS
jgi:hypothetical protein